MIIVRYMLNLNKYGMCFHNTRMYVICKCCVPDIIMPSSAPNIIIEETINYKEKLLRIYLISSL